MTKRDFLSIKDYADSEIVDLIKKAYNLKAQNRAGKKHELLKGKTLAMIFDKPSTRTRVSFDVGMYQLGGHSLNITKQQTGMGDRESVADVARTMSRYCDAIMVRTFSHDVVEELAKYATVPVINGLTDSLHPCQALADGLTIFEREKTLAGVKLTYIGDPNNVLSSLIYLADKTGLQITVCAPKGYDVDPVVLDSVSCPIVIERDPAKAVANAQYIYTDVWVSMGQEDEREAKLSAFAKYQVNSKLLAKAPAGVKVMHCLPAHRGEEISDEVMESDNAIVFEQAENRMHAQKSILLMLLG